ncbi:substrate-binding periplasmic protein [Roseibium sp. SCP14]|uniref:substrate-binding periplasmic protein n=1 Tax=Roseibium sp. SCP14 TaxID=3141375 RepID=UPI0033396B02
MILATGIFFCLLTSFIFPANTENRPEITITASNYPPFEIAEPIDGLNGFDHEVVSEAFRRVGQPVRIVFLPWNRAIMEVKSGTAAAILSCAHRKQREEFFYYSDLLSTSTDGVYHRGGHPSGHIRNASDLIGERVAAVDGYSSFLKLRDMGIAPYSVPDDETGIKMLRLGRFDYFYNGKQATDFMISQSGDPGMFEFISFAEKPLYLCLSKVFPGAIKLLAEFNRGLAAVKADGTYALIHAKYK